MSRKRLNGNNEKLETLVAANESSEELDRKDETKETKIGWSEFIKNYNYVDITKRLLQEISDILSAKGSKFKECCILTLFEPQDSIESYELNKVFEALLVDNSNRDKDVILMMLSRGGSVEPAYQISKLCKAYAKNKFIAVVPRYAKSAATLIALGADEIHIGPLGQIGPIDPQLGGLPALGVKQALRAIALLSQRYPGSSDMFARYLRMVLTVEQIGYCERIGESAEQYAIRLLSKKSFLNNEEKRSLIIAKTLVNEYKDHGFVIDLDEAQKILGEEWVKSGTPELDLAEKIYDIFDKVNLYLSMHKNQRLLLIGKPNSENGIIILSKEGA